MHLLETVRSQNKHTDLFVYVLTVEQEAATGNDIKEALVTLVTLYWEHWDSFVGSCSDPAQRLWVITVMTLPKVHAAFAIRNKLH